MSERSDGPPSSRAVRRGRQQVLVGILLLAVLTTVSASVGQQSADVSLSIPVACGGDWKPLHGQGNFHPTQWDFTAGLGGDPGATGLIWSGNPGVVEGVGNGPCCFHVIASVFKATGPARWIETWLRITVRGVEPDGSYTPMSVTEIHVVNGDEKDQGTMSSWWNVPVPYYPTGQWEIVVEIGVMRRGYADPPGTYTAKVHMNIANTQNGCPPGQQK